MKNYSILTLVAATMALTSEAVKLQTVHAEVANDPIREECDGEECTLAQIMLEAAQNEVLTKSNEKVQIS